MDEQTDDPGGWNPTLSQSQMNIHYVFFHHKLRLLPLYVAFPLETTRECLALVRHEIYLHQKRSLCFPQVS